MIDAANRDGLTTVAWVSHHATSAGSLVAMACQRIYMARKGTIGSATPVTIGPAGIQPVAQDEDVVEKQYSHLRSAFRAWAEDHGRPPVLAEAMVDPEVRAYWVVDGGEHRVISGTEWDDARQRGAAPEMLNTIVEQGRTCNLTGEEAVRYGMADGIADSLDELVGEKLGLQLAPPITLERTRSEELSSLLEAFAGLILIGALLAAYVEFKMPGFGLPGIVSIVLFTLLLFGRYVTGLADVPHIVAIAAGLILIAAEVFVIPGSLWAGALGALMVVGGLLLTSIGPTSSLQYALGRELAVDSALHSLLWMAAAVVAMGVLSRFLPQTPVLRRLLLRPAGTAFAGAMQEAQGEHAELAHPGAWGRALTALRPVGKVALDRDDSVEYEARSEGPAIDAGEPVRVIEVSAGRLLVERAHGEEESSQ